MSSTPSSSPVIAIDGPAASGKGTLSRKIADTLGFAHLDTGALYRGAAYALMQDGGDADNAQACIDAAQAFYDTFDTEMLSNPALRQDDVGQTASKVASVPEVRTILLDLQRSFASHPPAPYKGAVLDGRDIGTVICPQAPAKLFITASTEVRAERRTKELQSKGQSVTYERVLQDMRERDTRDAGRSAAPMVAAEDALILDTSLLDIDQAFLQALAFVKEKLS